ncbi:hypothetical protein GGI18_000254 [Coemansia linderi]|uniref:Uncharacterized protein n=1 Tax=Coemansia linderi TaxID=2663919 RepID=A0ACC1KNQ6_9FUNG|nr:hypothetical protein GGI18_000254 [Coemansia linderi]
MFGLTKEIIVSVHLSETERRTFPMTINNKVKNMNLEKLEKHLIALMKTEKIFVEEEITLFGNKEEALTESPFANFNYEGYLSTLGETPCLIVEAQEKFNEKKSD